MAELIKPYHMLKSPIPNLPNFNILQGAAVFEFSQENIRNDISKIEDKYEGKGK